MRLRWLASLLLWFLLTTTAIAATGIASDGPPEGAPETYATAASLPGDRAVYKSALVVVQGDEGEWFDLNARYAFERLADRHVVNADGLRVPAQSFVHEWAAEPFQFNIMDFIFFDFPPCLNELTGFPDPATASEEDYEAWEQQMDEDFASMSPAEAAQFMSDLEACGEELEAWGEQAEERMEAYGIDLSAWGEDMHTVTASAWHVSHVHRGVVVASSLRRADAFDVPGVDGIWTVPRASEAPCGVLHSMQGESVDMWSQVAVYGACPPTMKFGVATTRPLEGPVMMRVSGEDRVGDWDTTVFAHEDDPDLLRLWFARDVAYPVRILSHVDVVPPEWITYANDGDPPAFYILQELIEWEPGAPAAAPAPEPMPPTSIHAAPWGPSDAGVGHPWPFTRALLESSRSIGSDLGSWMLDHPDAVVQQATYAGDLTWAFALTDGVDTLVATMQRTPGGPQVNTTGTTGTGIVPSDVPDAWVTVSSAARSHAALAGPTTGWSFWTGCDLGCRDIESHLLVGTSKAWGDDATHLTWMDAQGEWQGHVEDPSPYPEPRFADDAWDPSRAEQDWTWGVASGGTWAWPEPKTAAQVAAATGLISLLYLIWPLAKGAGALPLFSRIKSEDLLEHPVRQGLYGTIEAEPGIHFQELVRRIEKGRGTTEHHLRKLVAAGLLVEKAQGGFTCYFPKGAVDRRLMDAAPALKADVARQLLQAVHNSPGAVAAELSDRLGIPTSTVNYHLKKLAAAGLIESTRQGRSMALHATGLGDQAVGTFQT